MYSADTVWAPAQTLRDLIVSRSNRVSCDTVVNYEIVLANGSIVEANEKSHPDLFWALKGGRRS
jgi:hypothetical protein